MRKFKVGDVVRLSDESTSMYDALITYVVNGDCYIGLFDNGNLVVIDFYFNDWEVICN